MEQKKIKHLAKILEVFDNEYSLYYIEDRPDMHLEEKHRAPNRITLTISLKEGDPHKAVAAMLVFLFEQYPNITRVADIDSTIQAEEPSQMKSAYSLQIHLTSKKKVRKILDILYDVHPEKGPDSFENKLHLDIFENRTEIFLKIPFKLIPEASELAEEFDMSIDDFNISVFILYHTRMDKKIFMEFFDRRTRCEE